MNGFGNSTTDRLPVPANDNVAPIPAGACPFVRELPPEFCVPGNRVCIYDCPQGLTQLENSRGLVGNNPCRAFISPNEGRPYTPLLPTIVK
jgi:hypothetical protein